MEVYSLKDIAEELGVTYEAVRQQTIRYSDELKEHITKQGKKQFIDEWGLEFLRNKRREYHVVIREDQTEEVEQLRMQVQSLQTQLLMAQNKLLESQDKVIQLQDSVREGLEEKVRYAALLEEHTKTQEELAVAKELVDRVQLESNLQREQLEQLQAESNQKDKELEELRIERDQAVNESQSYHKSWFGFYRKD